MPINQDNIWLFNTAFVTILRIVVQSNTTDIYTDFIEQFFGRRFYGVLQPLSICQKVSIRLFNGDAQGKNGSNSGVAVLHKLSVSLHVCDSIYSSLPFNNVTSHLLQLENSSPNRLYITNQE